MTDVVLEQWRLENLARLLPCNENLKNGIITYSDVLTLCKLSTDELVVAYGLYPKVAKKIKGILEERDRTIYGDPMETIDYLGISKDEGLCPCGYNLIDEIIQDQYYPKQACIIDHEDVPHVSFEGTLWETRDQIRCPRCGTYYLVVAK